MKSELDILIECKTQEMAFAHAKILEDQCQLVCARFNCEPTDLILEYSTNAEISIQVKATRIKIDNVFYVDNDIGFIEVRR